MIDEEKDGVALQHTYNIFNLYCEKKYFDEGMSESCIVQ